MPTSLYNLMLMQGYWGRQADDTTGGYGEQFLTASIQGAYSQDPFAKFKNAAVVEYDKWVDGREVFALTDPYLPADKFRFEDSYRADGIVRRCINLIVKYALGRRTKTIIDITEEFAPAAAEDKVAAINEYLNDQESNAILTFIDSINRKVNMHHATQAAMIQAKVGGRAALLVETDKKTGIPTEVKILNWKKLGTVYIDRKTWKMLGVGYADRKDNDPFPMERLIYFVNHDYHISPDSLYYGLSDLEGVIHTSETNRMLNEIDIKEMARSRWAPAGLLRFKSDISADDARRFVRKFQPGTMNATTHEVELQQFNMLGDFIALINARDANDRYIARVLNVPSPLIGFEAITNRATLNSILQAWQDSDLANDRTMLQDTLEPQWLNKLLAIKFAGLKGFKAEDMVGRKGFSSLLPVKIKLEFENITFETLDELAKAIVPLFTNKLITIGKAAELMGFNDIKEELQKNEERDKIMKETVEQSKIELEKEKIRGGIELQKNAQSAQLNMSKQTQQEMLAAAKAGMAWAQNRGVPNLRNQLLTKQQGVNPQQQQRIVQSSTQSKLDQLKEEMYRTRIATYKAIQQKIESS